MQWVVVAGVSLLAGCGGGSSCPPQTSRLDGSCVSQAVADFVMCVRNRGNVELASDRGQQFGADAKIAGTGVKTVAEVRDRLDAKYGGTADAAVEKQIVDRCAAIVGAAAASRTPSDARVSTPSSTARPGGGATAEGPCGRLEVGVAYGGAAAAAIERDALNRVKIEPDIGHGDPGIVEVVSQGKSVRICGVQTEAGPDGQTLWVRPGGANGREHFLFVPVDPPGSARDFQCRRWVKSMSGRLTPMALGRPTTIRATANSGEWEFIRCFND